MESQERRCLRGVVSTDQLFELAMLLAIRLIVSRSDSICCSSIPSKRCSDSRCHCFPLLSASFAVAGRLCLVERVLIDVLRARLPRGGLSGGEVTSSVGRGVFMIPFFREAKNSLRNGTFPTGRLSCRSNEGIGIGIGSAIEGEGAN